VSSRDFYSSIHCRSEAHCAACRARYGGYGFRASLLAAFDLAGPLFACPRGLPWQEDRDNVPVLLQGYLTRAMQLSCGDAASKLLRAFTVQLCEIGMGTRTASCGARGALLRRLKRKLDYYWRIYAPTS